MLIPNHPHNQKKLSYADKSIPKDWISDIDKQDLSYIMLHVYYLAKLLSETLIKCNRIT